MLHPGILASLIFVIACALGPPVLADDGRHGGGGYHGGGRHGGHNSHWSGSWVIGIPWGGYGPGYYGPRYGYGYGYGAPYGYPWPYERRVIIERERMPAPELPAGPPPEALWYYCDSAGAYYPYVGSCPEPWRQVPAQPANATTEQRR